MPWPASRAFPRLYAILDAELLARRELDLVDTALRLTEAGVQLLQFRDKRRDWGAVLAEAVRLREALEGSGSLLILNDFADLVTASGFAGAHLGQGDLDPAVARELVGAEKLLGLSTHTEEQVRAADATDVDYIAIGPVFQTGTKSDAEPVVGVGGVRWARALTGKPLVAIGGISAASAPGVLAAGADSVAVIGALYEPGRSVGENARELLRAVEKGGGPQNILRS